MENTCWIVRGQPVQYLFDPETGKTKIGRHVEYPPMAIGSANVLGEDYEPEPAYVAACDAIRFATKQDAVAFTKIMQDAVSHESGYYHKQLTLNFDGVEFTVSEFPANAARGDGKCIRSERHEPERTPTAQEVSERVGAFSDGIAADVSRAMNAGYGERERERRGHITPEEVGG